MNVAIHTSCNKAYLPGLIVLVEGIRRSMPDIDIVVTSNDIEFVPGCQIVKPHPLLDTIKEYNRWNHAAWHYMNAASLDYDRVLMVGCDQLIVGDMSEIFEDMPEYGALVEYGKTKPHKYRDSFYTFCSGTMIVTPGNLPELVSIANECEWGLADQTVWNEWAFRNNVDVKQLPEYYDLTKRSFLCDPKRWNNLKDNAISVHYVGPDKPWMDNEDKRYSELNNVWRSYASGTPIPLPEAV